MASKWPPVKNQEFIFRCVLFAQSDNQIKANPTTAAGDWKVSTDGGAFANLATLPDVDPDTTAQVKVTLSASEMNGDEIMVTAIDASGDEWHSAAWVIHTVGQTFDAVDANIDSILEDTGTTIPGTLTTIDGIVDDILVDTGTTIPATLDTIDNFLDTEVAAILEDTGTTIPATLANLALETTAQSILTDTGTDGVVVAPRTVEGSLDEIEVLRLVLAALVGKAMGGGTATVTFRDTGDTTDRIILTVDSNGNRSAVTLDAS